MDLLKMDRRMVLLGAAATPILAGVSALETAEAAAAADWNARWRWVEINGWHTTAVRRYAGDDHLYERVRGQDVYVHRTLP
jgi:hypothetical protein